MQRLTKVDIVKLLYNNKELEEISVLKAIHDGINELKDNLIKLILEDNAKIKTHIAELERENENLVYDINELEHSIAKQDRYARCN